MGRDRGSIPAFGSPEWRDWVRGSYIFDGTGKHNIYRCERCGHVVITIDREKGVTPMFLSCKRSDRQCSGTMASEGYPAVAEMFRPTHEWYMPDTLEGLETSTRYHVEHGGLLLREIEPVGGARD
jgi:hypothetical protein